MSFDPCRVCTTPRVCAVGLGCGEEMRELARHRVGMRKLIAFGGAVLRAHREGDGSCDLDGGHLQALAETHGVLKQRTVTEPCSESCSCDVFGFPARCFFVADDVRPLLKD